MTCFSVVIACVNGLPSIADCLDSIKHQQGGDVEVVVVDVTDDGTAEYITREHPDVKLIKIAGRPGIPAMRARGMSEATGDYFVITEDHCIVPPNWIEMLERAHDRGYAVVGGAVTNGSTTRLIDRAVFLCEYSGYMPPIPSGEVDFVAGNNVSYRRAEIEAIDETVKKEFWEYFLQIELRKNGARFLSVPALEIVHKKEFGFFYFLSQRFHYSRSFAAMRSRQSTLGQRALQLAYTFVLPFHLTGRIARNIWGKGSRWAEFALSLPFLAVFMCSYAAGELAGILLGPGDSLEKVE